MTRSMAVVATRRGRPEVLRVEQREMPVPGDGEVLVRVLACSVSLPDVQARYGHTPFPPKVPFVPGYAFIGDVVAAGPHTPEAAVGDRVGVLAIVGGYAEHALARSRRLIPVPRAIDPAEGVTLILNYLVAYQVLHRVARVREGDTVLVIGASGGIGTALLQLGRLAGLRMYGLASGHKHDAVRAAGATPIDYRSPDVAEVIRAAVPGGLDAVLDGIGGEYVNRGLGLLRPGGVHVVYGNPLSKGGVVRLVWQLITTNLQPGGTRLRVYGTTSFLRNPRPYREDWATLFQLLERREIVPVIAQRFPLSEAARANEVLEGGGVTGNLVLVAPRDVASP